MQVLGTGMLDYPQTYDTLGPGTIPATTQETWTSFSNNEKYNNRQPSITLQEYCKALHQCINLLVRESLPILNTHRVYMF